jgi:hypothetical protein
LTPRPARGVFARVALTRRAAHGWLARRTPRQRRARPALGSYTTGGDTPPYRADRTTVSISSPIASTSNNSPISADDHRALCFERFDYFE